MDEKEPLSVDQMGMGIAKRYLHGSPREQAAILSCFTDEEKVVFLRFMGYYKLFCDQAYYDAVKKAVCEQISKEWFGDGSKPIRDSLPV